MTIATSETLANSAPTTAAEIGAASDLDSRMQANWREQALVYEAVNEAFGHNKHRALGEYGTPARAQICASATVGGHDDPEQFTAKAVNPRSGTMVLAESSGSRLAAELTAHGFERLMLRKRTAEQHISTGLGQVDRALRRTVPTMVRRVHTKSGTDAWYPEASVQAAQLVDNRLVYRSDQPLYVFGPAGNCDRLGYGPSALSRVQTLADGRNVVVMISGAQHEALPATFEVQAAIRSALHAPSPHPEGHSPQQLAGHVARHLHNLIRAENPGSTVLVSLVDVAAEREAPLLPARRMPSPQRAPKLGQQALAAAAHPAEYTARHQPEAKKRPRREQRASLPLGRLALSVVMLGLMSSLAHADTASAAQRSTDRAMPPSVPPVVQQHVPDTRQLSVQLDKRVVLINQAAPDTFLPTYAARRNDPANRGEPSNVTSIVRQGLAYYGQQAGLPAAEITRLQNDPVTVNGGIAAFTHDPNPHNNQVLHDPRTWVYNGVTYSTAGVAAYDKKITADDAARLGVTPPAASPPPSPPSGGTKITAPNQQTVTSTASESADEKTALLAMTGLGVLAATAIAALTLGPRRSRSRRSVRGPGPAPQADDVWERDADEETAPAIEPTAPDAAPVPVAAVVPAQTAAGPDEVPDSDPGSPPEIALTAATDEGDLDTHPYTPPRSHALPKSSRMPNARPPFSVDDFLAKRNDKLPKPKLGDRWRNFRILAGRTTHKPVGATGMDDD